ncbi:hypothetical protein SERLA73DRAFT_131418 [Serpula lacrymans var. lacrymans S7.3]|uniref:Uncharacterized protein n=1 Tax=Serpula lacrymans var. lacrymans (strain S7.3) TaxID=936435 RepID=F8PMZ9_SERL3|nr:hypothetical protein SERLA73DRAFT_131418 [Serpula lacrymans var. lacrymans S7.3]
MHLGLHRLNNRCTGSCSDNDRPDTKLLISKGVNFEGKMPRFDQISCSEYCGFVQADWGLEASG